jgi:hypothetical protein
VRSILVLGDLKGKGSKRQLLSRCFSTTDRRARCFLKDSCYRLALVLTNGGVVALSERQLLSRCSRTNERGSVFSIETALAVTTDTYRRLTQVYMLVTEVFRAVVNCIRWCVEQELKSKATTPKCPARGRPVRKHKLRDDDALVCNKDTQTVIA